MDFSLTPLLIMNYTQFHGENKITYLFKTFQWLSISFWSKTKVLEITEWSSPHPPQPWDLSNLTFSLSSPLHPLIWALVGPTISVYVLRTLLEWKLSPHYVFTDTEMSLYKKELPFPLNLKYSLHLWYIGLDIARFFPFELFCFFNVPH